MYRYIRKTGLSYSSSFASTSSASSSSSSSSFLAFYFFFFFLFLLLLFFFFFFFFFWLHAFFAVDPRGDQPVFPTPFPPLSRRGYPDNTRPRLNSFITLEPRATRRGSTHRAAITIIDEREARARAATVRVPFALDYADARL